MNDLTKEREAFEAWYEGNSLPGEVDWFALDSMGDYRWTDTAACWDGWQARAALSTPAQAVPKGFVLVPAEPTREMLDAGGDADCTPDKLLRAIYQAMLAAAPQQPAVQGGAWRPIETAPKDGTTVLTFRLLHGEPQIADARFYPQSNAWGQRSWRYPENDGPSHWMFLLPFPSQTQGGER